MLKGIDELIANQYGSKKGLLRYWRHHPAWNSFDWSVRPDRPGDIQRLVFICQGNICRSAMAASVAEQLGLPSVSYGLDTDDGKEAEPRMIEAARQLGYDLTAHQASRIERYQPQRGDLACLMEPAHRDYFLAAFSDTPPMTLLGLWHRQPSAYIHDPLCCGQVYFANCAKFIQESVTALSRSMGAHPGNEATKGPTKRLYTQ